MTDDKPVDEEPHGTMNSPVPRLSNRQPIAGPIEGD
jgi:hypothetical protein